MIHIGIGRKTFCGNGWVFNSLTFGWITRHFELSVWLVRWFGCAVCRDRMVDAIRSARPIR